MSQIQNTGIIIVTGPVLLERSHVYRRLSLANDLILFDNNYLLLP
jgi:hypothetical protein